MKNLTRGLIIKAYIYNMLVNYKQKSRKESGKDSKPGLKKETVTKTNQVKLIYVTHTKYLRTQG
ncbi:hypothetical protein DRO64_01355 [Candidatus Bathyarchaeota archaeon]|nr:MAG: hypothetical protein DRJ59_06860 [Thermoprotei archaeon]RLI46177.1 MAG: hypothetical protein DRO64_01355 [Candidatus Bathyarchaeota archaeon]